MEGAEVISGSSLYWMGNAVAIPQAAGSFIVSAEWIQADFLLIGL